MQNNDFLGAASRPDSELADRLLNQHAIRVVGPRGPIVVRIIEIEFYKHCAEHRDIYVHCAHQQLEHNRFYFHRLANGSYKGGTFKGMDYVIGDAARLVYFGVLIRTILVDGVATTGPCCCVEKIIELMGVRTVAEADVNQDAQLSLVSLDPATNFPLFAGPRIGLNPVKDPAMAQAPYRFVTLKRHVKKQVRSLAELRSAT